MLRLSRKGQESGSESLKIGVPELIGIIIFVGTIFFIWYALQGKYWEFYNEIQRIETLRAGINLAQVLIGSEDALAFSDGDTTYKALLDKSKLDQIDSRISDIYYPGYAHEVTVTNLMEANDKWTFKHGSPKSEATATLPVSIRYSDSKIDLGVIKIVISKE